MGTFRGDDTLLQSMAAVLRAARAKCKLSQEGLAARAGVDRTVVSRVESAQRLPSLPVFCLLAYAVDDTPHGLLAKVIRQTASGTGAKTDAAA